MKLENFRGFLVTVVDVNDSRMILESEIGEIFVVEASESESGDGTGRLTVYETKALPVRG